MDLCCWAAPALMERRRAGREEWKKRKWRRKGKAETDDGGGGGQGARFPPHLLLSARHPHKHAGEHKDTHTHQQIRPTENPRRLIGSVKG